MTALPALLLMHGVGDSGACWGPFVRRLHERPGLADLVVATPDAPAHGGRRAQRGQTIAWPDLPAEAITEAEALVARTRGPIVVGGHSMGSMVALGVAANRPDLVVATFLEDPPLMQGLPDEGGSSRTETAEPPTPVDVSEFGDWFAELQSVPLADVVAAARTDHPTWDEEEYEIWADAKQSWTGRPSPIRSCGSTPTPTGCCAPHPPRWSWRRDCPSWAAWSPSRLRRACEPCPAGRSTACQPATMFGVTPPTRRSTCSLTSSARCPGDTRALHECPP